VSLIPARDARALPPNQHFIEITIPPGVSYEMFNQAAVPDWYLASAASSKPYGEAWQQEGRSLILIVQRFTRSPMKTYVICATCSKRPLPHATYAFHYAQAFAEPLPPTYRPAKGAC
jgi:RES domain-containing protein